MLKHRVQSALVLGGALLAAVLWLPGPAVLAVLLVICAVATWEFYDLLDAARVPNFRFVGVLGGLALVVATWFSLWRSGGRHAEGEWLVLVVLTLLLFVRQFPQKHNDQPMETMGGTLLGVMYVPFLFNFFTRLMAAWPRGDGRWLILYLIVVVKFTDIGAYFIGCGIGRHKMFPRISPAKSWEGTVGGVLTGVLASLAYYYLSGGDLGVVSISLADAVTLGLILAVTGIVGDLAESLIKRAAGAKDSGVSIQGMGGLLDLLDSLLFAAPALYVYVRFFL